MRTADVLILDFDLQIGNTRRTLERIPEDSTDWVPHEKSMAIGRLAMHCAVLPQFGQFIIEDDSLDLAAPRRPFFPLVFTTAAEAVQRLDETAAQCRSSLAGASDEHLAQSWRFSFRDQLISDVSRSLSYRSMFFNHLVHHTAQLGVYLRLRGIPVPGLFGPSADEPFATVAGK